MYNKFPDIRTAVKSWYVVRGNEHLRMGSWEDALELSRISDAPCKVMSDQFYKYHYHDRKL